MGLAALAVVAAGLGWSAWTRLRPHPAWVAAPVSPGPAVALQAAPSAYRVIYRVDAGVPVGATVRTETLEVQRPFQSRLTTSSGKPPGHAVTEVQTSDLGQMEEATAGQDPSVLVPQPDLAASDLRLDVALPDLIRAGAVQVRERRQIDGRLCQVYRTTSPPQGQTMDKLPSASGDAVDTCVDAQGLVLEQLQWFHQRLLLRRRAVRVQLQPAFGPHFFDFTAAPTVPTYLGGGQVVQVDPAATQPGTTYYLDHPPAGFTFQGRYAVAPSTPPQATGVPDGNRRAGFLDVWVKGADTVFLDQGGLLYGGTPFGSTGLGTAVDLGPLGPGQQAPGARLSEVYASLPGGRYVRLAGTLPVSELAGLARTLRAVERPAG